jgi:ParB family transcriptional regulator, chromosome partitioning protein
MNAQPQPDRTHIPLDQLALSPLNARKTGGKVVDDIAASIAAHGLLQNLTVTAPANGIGAFEVVAGGRRLAALQLLQREKRLPTALASEGIPCRIITGDVALEASTAENTLREAMHPADQCDAFKAMIEAGETIADIAAHFGVSELVVKQRLKLANVNPKLVQIYRDGGMNLDQLQALAITDNHEQQRQAWYTAKGDWERHPNNLREHITRQEVEVGESALAKFVGIDEYVAAGGQVRRDLFSDRAWITDAKLLDTQAMDKLEAAAQAERDAGWSWAEARLHMDYQERAEYPQLPEPEQQFASEADAKRAEEIDARLNEIEYVLSPKSDEEWEALQAEGDDLEKERNEIEQRTFQAWPAETKATAGVLVTLDRRGNIEFHRGRLKPGQKLDKKSGAVTGEAKAEKPAADKPKPATLNAAVLTNLSAHRAAAARYHVARDPQLALALLVDALIAGVGHGGARHHNHADVLKITARTGRDGPGGIAEDIHAALRRTDDLPEACRKQKIPGGAKRLPWLIQQPQADLLQMLAYLTSQTMDGITERDNGHAGIDALHAAIGFNMADHWTPACDNFLGRIPKPLVLQAVTEAKGKDQAQALANLKNAELTAEAGKQLGGTGWLPKPLRGPGYAVGAKPAPASKAKAKKKPAAKKPAKKATTRKPAKKAAKAVPA